MKLPALIVALPVMVSSLVAQVAVEKKSYVLASKSPPVPVGKTFTTRERVSMPDAKMGITVLEQKIEGTFSSASQEETVMEYLDANKIRITYVKNRSLEKTKMMGQEEDDETINALEGKVVILEKKDGKWSGKLEKGDLEADEKEEFDEEVEALTKELNEGVAEDLVTYGLEPRKVGDVWDVDPRNVPGLDDLKVVGGKMTLRFVEVKEFNGEPCAVFESTFNIKGEMTEKEMEGASAIMEGSLRHIRSLKYFMDYKMGGKFKMAVAGEMEPQPGMVAAFSMQGEMKAETVSLLKKEE